MTGELCVVHLKNLPVEVLTRAQAHTQTLMRELALIHTADEQGVAPARLLWLSQQLRQRYAALNTEPRETLQRAIEGGQPRLDVRYELPEDAATAAAELGDALDEVDDYCRNGDLLTLVTPPEALAFRQWFLAEFVTQIREHAEPTPWSDAADCGDTSKGHVDATTDRNAGATGPSTIIIDDELDLEGAARVRGEFTNLLEQGVVDLTVDLASCTFIDSVGISLLLTTRERLRDSGGSLLVTNADGATKRTLQTTGVYDILSTGT
jgi:anti-sigma B factor antagonist